jgi:hypothetical protein
MRHTFCIRVAMADPTFSVIQKDGGWFWCSLTLMSENELIGPFPPKTKQKKTRGQRSELGKNNNDHDLCT